MSSAFRSARLAAGLMVVVLASSTGCRERPAAAAVTAPLRVCADPNNLPFSNDRLEGFENRLAQLIAEDLGITVEYTWWAQRRGFLRSTLQATLCDVVMGIPPHVGAVDTTRPYYRSTYVFVTRAAARVAPRSFEDPALRHVRIGVPLLGDEGGNAPPAHELSRRGIVRNVVGYSVLGDYSTATPAARLVTAVADGEVDVAIAWGPLAGYFAALQPVALAVRPIGARTSASLPLEFDIAVGVRRGDSARLAVLQTALDRRRAEIDALLARYRVPRVDAHTEGAS